MYQLFIAIVLVLGISASNTLAKDYVGRAEVDDFIQEMVTKHDFTAADLTALFAQVERKQQILDAIARPAEKTKTWGEYRNIFIEEKRIANGAKFWRENVDTLVRAEQSYGVPPQYVVAIIGVETRYGAVTGSYRVIDALATLGFDYPPRSTFFRKELENYLLLSREQKQDPLVLKGSYAGAMGYGQFMPSSYRAYAVDFDGDEFKDIWQNPIDAIGSVANYFSRHGWQAGEKVAVRARVNDNFDPAVLSTRLNLTHSIAQLAAAGVQPVDDIAADTQAIAMRHQGELGAEFWLGFKNFEVITRYNRSQMYALAVFQLSEEIKQRYDTLQAEASAE